jgi:uncharacterized protein YktA (UPF0223 family)
MPPSMPAQSQQPSAKDEEKLQYERFLEQARELGVDNEKGAATFEQAFEKIVPAKKKERQAPLAPKR